MPIGALVSFIQKGFQFMELEANLNEEGTDVYGKYINLTAREILTKDLKELREAARELKLEDAETGNATSNGNGNVPSAPVAAAAACIDLPLTSLEALTGHATAEVNSLSWSAAASALATACGDGAARVWAPQTGQCKECQHTPSGANSNDDLVAAEWAPDGQTLAAATMSGEIHVWGADGTHRLTTTAHHGGVLTLQWSRDGEHLASGSADGSVIVWDPSTGDKRREWTLPNGAAAFDLHWRSATALAVGGQDGTVAVYSVTQASPLHVSREHGAGGSGDDGVAAMDVGGMAPGSNGQINMLRWDPSGSVLATASNDMTIGIWQFPGDELGAGPHLLAGHKREVTAVAWRGGDWPGGDGAVLASGSADGSVRLWSVEAQRCVGVLDRHEDGIMCLCWSPDGAYLATGDGAGNVTVWAVGNHTGAMVRTLKGHGAVGDLLWIDGGAALAVTFFGAPGVGILSLADLKK